MITHRQNLRGYNIASVKECWWGSQRLLCTYVDVDRQGGNMLQTAMQSAFWLRGPQGPFLRDTHLPIFLYCLKYKNVTLVSYNDHLQVERTKQTRAHICSALIIITFLRARIGWLCKIPTCYCLNFIGCFRKYTNPGQDVYGINCTNGHPTSVTGRCVVCLQKRLASRTIRLIHFSLYSKNSVLKDKTELDFTVHRQRAKLLSLTGNQTRAMTVRAPNPNN